MSFDLRNYALVTLAYWGFTLTDGALRMLVLLHFHDLGYDAFQIALLFVLYEVFGIVTNLVGGWLGSRFGLKLTLFSGLSLQVAALLMLSVFDPTWGSALGLAYVMSSQALSGIAKDLTKMSAKTAIKVLIPDDAHSALFKWVALLTGSKNALKGVGFFLGGLLLSMFGFAGALVAMAAGLAVVLALSAVALPGQMGQAKAKVKFSSILSKSQNINVLSAARFFLFGSRDVWFVVGLPVFLAAQLDWAHTSVSAYMAAWVIGYGFIQAAAPKILKRTGVPGAADSRLWKLVLFVVTVAMTVMVWAGVAAEIAVLGGLIVFGAVFALNSAIHSYLILVYTDSDSAALNVGFYYMANAGGRLVGTLASGAAYQWGGLVACLGVSALFVLMSWAVSFPLRSTPDGQSLKP